MKKLTLIIFSFIFVALLTPFFLSRFQIPQIYAQTDITTTPPFFCLGPCPTVSPSITSQPSTMSSPHPSQVSMTTQAPTVDPCASSTVASLHAKDTRFRHHRKRKGAVSNFMQFLLQLIERIIQQLLGTPAPPQAPTLPGPTSAPNSPIVPAPNPCQPTVAATNAPQPSSAPQSPTIPATNAPIAQNCTSAKPITITQGGTYSGCYVSTNAGTPAVMISTTAPVTIDHATIQHAGIAIGGNNLNLTLTNSKIQALNANATVDHRVLEVTSPSSIVVEHNSLIDGNGMWFGGGTPSMIRIRYNDVKNIGRYPKPVVNGNCCIQMAQFTQLTTGGGEIAWNRVMNTYLQSGVEDNINMYESSGQDASHPIDIQHNLISGAYPLTGNGSDYTGGGILGGDSGGNYINIHDNRVVSTSNYGVAITGGHDNHIYGNHIVNDGKGDNGSAVGPSTASGISLWQYDTNAATGPNATAYNNTIGWLQPGGKRNDTYIPACNPASACTNNAAMPDPITAATEQAERDAWAADVKNAGLTIGPNW